MTLSIPTWYIPSFYGDIRLASDDGSTIVIAEKLTPAEEGALETLLAHAKKKKWVDADKPSFGEGSHRVQAPMHLVAKVIGKVLKPGREMISVVTFKDGKIIEMPDPELATRLADHHEHGRLGTKNDGPFRDDTAAQVAAREAEEKVATAATSVAKPTLGCPAPDFDRIEIKAREVLMAFLSPEQKDDFRTHNRFISEGASDTRYMVTSRHARDSLGLYTRSLYDLDENLPLCVHDWSVPAAEEMLALHVMLQIPDHERYLRHLEGVEGT